MTTKQTLVEAFRQKNANLLAKYPAQAPNASLYEAQATSARLGKMIRNVSVKGTPNAYRRGDYVLVWDDPVISPDGKRIWRDEHDIPTVVDSSRVLVIE